MKRIGWKSDTKNVIWTRAKWMLLYMCIQFHYISFYFMDSMKNPRPLMALCWIWGRTNFYIYFYLNCLDTFLPFSFTPTNSSSFFYVFQSNLSSITLFPLHLTIAILCHSRSFGLILNIERVENFREPRKC